jgi:hypothetical protein
MPKIGRACLSMTDRAFLRECPLCAVQRVGGNAGGSSPVGCFFPLSVCLSVCVYLFIPPLSPSLSLSRWVPTGGLVGSMTSMGLC